MEDIFGKILKKDPNFEFIGKEQQILQLILSPQGSIFTRASNILYMSSNLNQNSNLATTSIVNQMLGIFQ